MNRPQDRRGDTATMAEQNETVNGAAAGELNLTKLRQHYEASIVESEDEAQRLLWLGVGFAVAVPAMLAPLLGNILCTLMLAATFGSLVVARRQALERLRHLLLMHKLDSYLPLELELWQRLGRLKHLPAPINQYVEHFLGTYVELKRHVRDSDKVELGQVQLIQARDHVLDFLDLAERTGAIRTILDTMSAHISDEDQIRLRQRFAEQCAGLQAITQSFDRTLGNLLVAQVLGDELGETTVADVQERMMAIEDELAEVKQSLAGED
jgi:hypothetical protein